MAVRVLDNQESSVFFVTGLGWLRIVIGTVLFFSALHQNNDPGRPGVVQIAAESSINSIAENLPQSLSLPANTGGFHGSSQLYV